MPTPHHSHRLGTHIQARTDDQLPRDDQLVRHRESNPTNSTLSKLQHRRWCAELRRQERSFVRSNCRSYTLSDALVGMVNADKPRQSTDYLRTNVQETCRSVQQTIQCMQQTIQCIQQTKRAYQSYGRRPFLASTLVHKTRHAAQITACIQRDNNKTETTFCITCRMYIDIRSGQQRDKDETMSRSTNKDEQRRTGKLDS